LLGPDRPGLVELVAGVIAAHGRQLAGEPDVAPRREVRGHPARRDAQPNGLQAALAALPALESRGLKVIAEGRGPETDTAAADRSLDLELVGLDRPGIVREISQLLASSGVNVEELVTNRTSAPMSGDMLFEARAHMRVPAGTDIASLRAGLERLANDLVVEVKLEER
jgi:glycine cleavage system regulatory protein